MHNTENLFLLPCICYDYEYIINEKYGAGKCQQLVTNLPSFNISLLQQFIKPRQLSKILGISKMHSQSVCHDGDRLIYTQAEEVWRPCILRSQQQSLLSSR